MVKSLSLLVVLFLLGGCATSSNLVASKIRSQIARADYVGALATVGTDKFYKQKQSILLTHLEKAMLFYRQGEYTKALSYFDRAKATSDSLYTKSISKKVATFITNSNSDNYYGERYERSMLRFYLVMTNYMIYQKGSIKKKDPVKGEIIQKLTKKERINYLSASRSYLLEWDSLLKTYQSEREGKSTYKNDMAAKVIGAIVHQEIGSSGDRQIAMQLLKDAKKLLVKNYGAYPSFNFESKKYRKDFSKFPKLGLKKVKKKYVRLTPQGKSLVGYLEQEIKKGTRKRTKKIQVIINNNLISEKKPRIIDVFIPIIDVAPIPKGMSFGTFVRKMLSVARGARPSIKFELPEIAQKPVKYQMKLIVKDLHGKELASSNVILINPLSDMAYEALDEKIASIKLKVGVRVAMKHAVALSAAYATYKAMYKKNSFFAFLAATAAYIASNKAIAASEQADVRYWITLPHDIRLATLNLKPGKYHFFLEKKDPHGNLSFADLGLNEIGQNTSLLNLNSF